MFTDLSTGIKSIATLLVIASAIASRASDLSPEAVIARHLDSIGSAEARAAVKSLVVQGTLKFRILVGGGGEVTGTWGRVSQQRESNFVMRFGKGGDWYGEQFIFDGDRTSFATATSSHTRSVFAQFVSSQDFILKEGLLGGEFSTAWALQHLGETHAKLQFLGSKKIDGRELIGVQYYSKTSTDMQVKIYFDPETYHHVMTVYEIEIPAGNAVQITGGAFLHDTRYTIEERFSGFQAVDGLTLPSRYQLQFTQELQNGNTRVYDWDMTADQIRNNLSLDSANFRLR